MTREEIRKIVYEIMEEIKELKSSEMIAPLDLKLKLLSKELQKMDAQTIEEIKKLKTEIADKEKELEEIVFYKSLHNVNKEVRNNLKFWAVLLAVIVVLFLGIGVKFNLQLQEKYTLASAEIDSITDVKKTIIENNVEKIIEANNEKIDIELQKIIEEQKTIMEEYTEEINNGKERFNSLIDEKIEEIVADTNGNMKSLNSEALEKFEKLDQISYKLKELEKEVDNTFSAYLKSEGEMKSELGVDEGWCYYGKKVGSKWETRYFVINYVTGTIPKKNKSVVSLRKGVNSVNVRDAEPTKKFISYKFGKKIGVIKSRRDFVVTDVKTIGKNNEYYWVKIDKL